MFFKEKVSTDILGVCAAEYFFEGEVYYLASTNNNGRNGTYNRKPED